MARIEQKTDKAIRASTKSVKSLDGVLRNAATAAAAYGKAFVAGFAVSAISGLGTAALRAVSAVADLADAANRAGVSAEKLQVLRFALEQNGASADDADAALSRLTKTIGEAATNASGPAAETFKALGVNIRDAGGQVRSTESIFDDVVNQLSRVESQAQVAAVGARLFGREAGSALAPTLQQGSAALADFEADLRSTGNLMSNELVAKADELDDRFARLQNTIGNAFKIAAVEVADAVADIIGEMNRLAAAIPKPIDAAAIGAEAGRMIGNPIGSRLDRAFGAAGSVQDDRALRQALLRKRFGPTINPDLDTGGSGKSEAQRERERAAAKAEREAERVRDAEHRRRLEVLSEAQDKVTDSIQRSRDMAQGFAETFISGIRSGEGALNSLISSVDGLIGKLADLALNSAFNSLFGGAGGALSAGASAAANSGFAGLFAGGGQIGHGQWGIVGERGPEAIRGPATIKPLEVSRQGAGSSVVINFAPTLAAGVSRAEVEQTYQRFKREAPALIANARARGGL